MNKIKKLTASTLATIIGLTAVAAPVYAYDHLDTIYEIADANLPTLTAAVNAAELDALLNDKDAGPFTVFAPLDSAFAAIDPDTLSDLLLPENKDALTSILTYHVVSGSVMSTDLSHGMIVPTLNGETIEVTISGSDVFINDAQVVTANIEAANGVVHIIDTVLMPPAEEPENPNPSIAEIAVSDPDNFSSLVSALDSQGLVDTLTNDGPFTVFAPTNEAFERLPNYVKRALERNPDLLAEILKYHVVSGTIESSDIGRYQKIDTLEGSSLTARSMRSSVRINNASVVQADIQASNGVVHVIDRVLIPRSIFIEERSSRYSCRGHWSR